MEEGLNKNIRCIRERYNFEAINKIPNPNFPPDPHQNSLIKL